MKSVRILNQLIGPGNSCFIIAEAGVNHNGDLALAFKLIDAALQAGANAVKFQTFTTETLVTTDAPKAAYQFKNTASQETQYQMLKKLELSHDDHFKLKSYCDKKRILFLSTPFDEKNTDFLVKLGVQALKVSSGDLTNLPLLTHMANKNIPMIISTGMANMDEVKLAVHTIKQTGNEKLILLHCVSNYPADPVEMNLRALQTMQKTFDLPIGLSDHTLGIEISLAAIALGACLIEKHLTLDHHLPGPDHQASLEPKMFASMVEGIRNIEKALGHGRKEPTPNELITATAARRSLVASCDIPEGTKITEKMIAIKRPGNGLSPALRPSLIGRIIRTPVSTGSLFKKEMFE